MIPPCLEIGSQLLMTDTALHPASALLCCAGRRRPVRVVGVAGGDDLAARLRASGLWEGAVVELIGKAPFGDPLLFALHGFRIALRRDEAARVSVVPETP